MAKVGQRPWKIPGQRAKRKAWGFTVQIVEDGKRKQKRVYKAEWTRDDAEQALAAELLKIEQEPKKSDGMTLAQASERYQNDRKARLARRVLDGKLAEHRRKILLAEDERLVKHLKSAFGADTQLAAITASRISEYKTQRLQAMSVRRKDANGNGTPLSAASINRPLALLRHLLRVAHEEWEALPAVPKVKLEKEPEGRIRWLEPGEETRLLAACAKSKNPEVVKKVTIALESGLRAGELAGLDWEKNIDMSRGVIRLELTKSGRRREVPMRQVVYNTLAGLPEPHEGAVWKHGDIRTAFENAVEAAKIDDFHFHDCRHHFASWFVMRGGSLQALKEILGHTTLAMTMRYAHLAPDHLRSEVAKTERRNESASSSTQHSTQEVDRLVGVSQKSSS